MVATINLQPRVKPLDSCFSVAEVIESNTGKVFISFPAAPIDFSFLTFFGSFPLPSPAPITPIQVLITSPHPDSPRSPDSVPGSQGQLRWTVEMDCPSQLRWKRSLGQLTTNNPLSNPKALLLSASLGRSPAKIVPGKQNKQVLQAKKRSYRKLQWETKICSRQATA